VFLANIATLLVQDAFLPYHSNELWWHFLLPLSSLEMHNGTICSIDWHAIKEVMGLVGVLALSMRRGLLGPTRNIHSKIIFKKTSSHRTVPAGLKINE
jgi:hypothetical protein